MSIYNKIIELSIAIFSMVSLVFNILFPHIAEAKEIGINNVLTFNFSESANVSTFTLAKEDNFVIDIKDVNSIGANQKEVQKIVMLPFMLPVEVAAADEPIAKKNNQVQLVLAEIETGQTNDEIADNICKAAGIVDLPCWQDLKAMRMKESYDGKAMTGDGGRSRGWYHIQIKMHGISDACALDFKCSTKWTVKNLIAHNYLTNRAYAISRHNGGGKMAQAYAKNVIYNSSKFE